MRAWRLRELMEQQTFDRRETGRGLQAGDVVQDEGHGEYRMVVAAASAGECLEAKADGIAWAHRREKTTADQRSE